MKKLISSFCCLCFLFSISITNASNLNSRLALHYSFEETSEKAIPDHSGKNLYGAVIGSPKWVPGIVGSHGLLLNGKDSYIRIINKNLPQLSDKTFSVSFWVRLPSPGKSRTIFQISGSRNRGWALGIDENGSVSFSGVGLKGSYGASAGGVINDADWHMISLVRNEDNYLLYVDGVSNKLVSSPDRPAVAGGCSMTIGIRWNINDCSLSKIRAYHSFSIDDVRLYGRALSAEDIQELYALRNPSSETPIPGKCSPISYGCLSGTLGNKKDQYSEFKWSCKGHNGGKDSHCSVKKKMLNGMCGKTRNSCNYGLVKDIPDSSSNYLWQCLGRNGGESTRCMANRENNDAEVVSVNNKKQLIKAINEVKGGSVIALASGDYGRLQISQTPSKSVSIIAASGATPVFSGIEVTGNNWRFSGLHIRPRFPNVGKAFVLNGTKNIIIENSEINFSDSVKGWSKTDWVQRTDIAIGVYNSSYIRIQNNRIRNVRHGILGTLSHGVISGNLIDGFRGDGMQFSGTDHSNLRIENNIIKNVYHVDKAHNDGIQFYTIGKTSGKRRTRSDVGKGVISDVVIRGNTIIQHEDVTRQHPGLLQGIGCFDGTFKNWVIEDNVVIVGHWHGISTYGVENMIIRNNTVLDIHAGKPTPWIRINNHKNGTLPVNGLVESNIAPAYTSKPSVTERGNVTVRFDEYHWYFGQWRKGDVKPKEESGIRNAGVRFE